MSEKVFAWTRAHGQNIFRNAVYVQLVSPLHASHHHLIACHTLNVVRAHMFVRACIYITCSRALMRRARIYEQKNTRTIFIHAYCVRDKRPPRHATLVRICDPSISCKEEINERVGICSRMVFLLLLLVYMLCGS